MKRRVSSWLIILNLLIGSALLPATPVQAATQEEIEEQDVFLKQHEWGHCTLSSTAMMLRRYALLRGDADWTTITEESISPYAWVSAGVRYSFSYTTSGGAITVAHDYLPGGSANREALLDLLEEHPEGIVIYYTGSPHAVLLTDYTDDVFYCADPAFDYPLGRIPLEESYTVREDNVTAYWYITSPKVEIEGLGNVREAPVTQTVMISGKTVPVTWTEPENQ